MAEFSFGSYLAQFYMPFLVFIAFNFELFCALIPLLPCLDNIIATTEWTFHLHPFPTIPCQLLIPFIYHGNRGVSYMYRFETRLVIAIQQRKCCAAVKKEPFSSLRDKVDFVQQDLRCAKGASIQRNPTFFCPKRNQPHSDCAGSGPLENQQELQLLALSSIPHCRCSCML